MQNAILENTSTKNNMCFLIWNSTLSEHSVFDLETLLVTIWTSFVYGFAYLFVVCPPSSLEVPWEQGPFLSGPWLYPHFLKKCLAQSGYLVNMEWMNKRVSLCKLHIHTSCLDIPKSFFTNRNQTSVHERVIQMMVSERVVFLPTVPFSTLLLWLHVGELVIIRLF